jgi:hypothetical protein
MKGEISKLNLLLGIVLIFVISAFLFFPGSAVTSSGGNFTVTPDNVSLNWTGDSINMTSNNDSVMIKIQNMSTGIQPKYGQENYGAGDYPNYNALVCFTNGMAFNVQNSSGTPMLYSDPLDTGNSTIFNLTACQYCPPGYYFGKFNVTQFGTNDWANVSAAVNIPVNPDNTFYEPNSTAYVKGTLGADSSLIHKYYFNTSLADNITGVTINLSGYTQDVDLYLFDSSGDLLARSVENGSIREGVYRDLPSTPDMWEIWVWGNVTSQQNYLANMYFTTLNVTNTSDEEVSSMDFGDLDPENNESNEMNITISNVDTKVWTGVEEQSEIYRVETWNSKNVTGDYYFLVPYFAEKVKVKIEWTGGNRWFISLNDSTKTFIGNSSEKFETGNKTGSIQEEYVIYSGTINTGNDGLWKATVGNLTAINDDKYNLTVYVWHDQSGLLSSDYPTGGFNFQSAGSANSSKNVSLKITLPSPTISNGTYEGFIEYYKPGEWNLRVPVSFSVKAGNLLINDTFESTTVTRYDNTGFNRLGVGVLQITLPINNTGGKDLYFVGSTSDNALKKGSYYMNTSVGWPSIPIQAGSSDTIKINISINTSNTGDSPGVYTGWVRLVTANSTNASSSSHPFENLTINLKVNLESSLTVNVTEIAPTLIRTPSNITNMTLYITVKLANGTIVSRDEKINQSNFYNVYLQEGNTSYLSSTTLQNLTHSSTSGTWSDVCPNGETHCRLNGTLLSGKPGGLYYAYASARLNTSVFGGTGILITGTNRSFMQTAVNDTGLKISEAENIDILEGQEKIYVIKINNYGYKNAVNVEVRFDKGTCPLSVSRESTNTTCSGKTGGATSADWEFDINKYTNCLLAWDLDAGSVTQDTDCDATIEFRTSHTNYGDEDVDVDVDDNATANGGEEDGDAGPILGCTSNSSCATDEYCKNGVCITLSCSSGWYASGHECKEYEKELSITDYDSKVYMLQGGSNSTKATVKNTGDYELKAKLKVISDLEGLTEDVNPSSYTLKPAKSGVFEIDFSVSNTTEVGYHKITLEAYASVYSDVYTTKNITLAVKPLEETKGEINQTYDDLKDIFDSIVSIFNQIPPSSEPNYTIANRTYNRLLSMLKDAEEKLKAGNYLDAYSVMKDANSSLTSFKQEVDRLVFEGGQIIIGDTLTWVAILVVIVVIGGFLLYLLLPPKRGYHPTLGFVPKEKVSITDRLKKLFSHVKKIKDIGRGQRTLEAFERPMPVPKEKPLPVLPEKPPEKKTYMEGYERPEEGRYSFKKKGKELKKKLFGK